MHCLSMMRSLLGLHLLLSPNPRAGAEAVTNVLITYVAPWLAKFACSQQQHQHQQHASNNNTNKTNSKHDHHNNNHKLNSSYSQRR